MTDPATTARYVAHQFVWPEVWDTQADEEGWPAHVESVLRRDAIDAGLSLIGAPERVDEPERLTIDTDAGPVKALTAQYRALAAVPVVLDAVTVEAVESQPGIWTAEVPQGVPVVNVKHGLGTLDVDVDATDEDGRPVGYRGFVPISSTEVEIVPGSTTRRVMVTLVPEDDAADQSEPGEPTVPAST